MIYCFYFFISTNYLRSLSIANIEIKDRFRERENKLSKIRKKVNNSQNKYKYKIIYTLTDEAPLFATFSLFDYLQSIFELFECQLDLKDISLAARVLSSFSDFLPKDQQTTDDLSYLQKKVRDSDCLVIKLPNISASVSQLNDCITELQNKGYSVPNYPMVMPDQTDKVEYDIYQRYQKVLGSAVNPRLRDGNSDRRIPDLVKKAGKKNPSVNSPWSKQASCEVVSMKEGDFYQNEKSFVSSGQQIVDICFVDEHKNTTVLYSQLKLDKGDIIDGSFLSASKLKSFIDEQKKSAKAKDLVFSLHLKATMMKVSDPKIFGCSLESFFSDFFTKHKKLIQKLQYNSSDGLKELITKLKSLSNGDSLVQELYDHIDNDCKLAMVDSDNKITNFHVNSDIIIDASMATVIRDGGKMWDQKGKLHYTKAVIPDRCYSSVYAQVFDFCKKHGALDPATMGSFANVGLMADKAQEYGSHPYTFVVKNTGKIIIRSSTTNQQLMTHDVEKEDIWRMCKTSLRSVINWAQLAIDRTKIDDKSEKTYVWLDSNRSHDLKVKQVIIDHFGGKIFADLGIEFVSPFKGCELTLMYLLRGKNVIGATGNVLRDYLTDLFPVLEIGTSAKMLSVIALNNGGGLFETGSGGTAPKHVKQFLQENHLRWNSLGEFLALSESVSFLVNKLKCKKQNSDKLSILEASISYAIKTYLNADRSPKRSCHQMDCRGSHFYFVLYLLEYLHNIPDSFEHKSLCKKLYHQLFSKKEVILKELIDVQGKKIGVEALGGYYYPHQKSATDIMRPSYTLNKIWKDVFLEHKKA